MEKNVAGKWIVFAYGLPDHASPGQAITGDAANITANVRIDGAAANAVDDTNPTELEDGYYIFDLTATESNGDLLLLAPASATANVQVIAVPGSVWTRPPNFNVFGIASDGDISGNLDGTVATVTTNTDMRGTDSAATATNLATVDTNVDAILVDTAVIGIAGAGLTDLGGMSTGMKAEVNAEADTALTDYDPPTNTEMEARTPTAAQLAYITANSATGMPVTFTTSGGSTTTAVIALVDGSAGSATDDQYNGRLLVFTDGTLKGVVTDITDYVGSTTTATITAIPFAPTASHNARLI